MITTDCSRFRDLADRAGDGALSAEEKAFMAAHAAECEPCRAIQRQAARLDELLKNRFSRVPDLDWNRLAGRVHDQIDARKTGSSAAAPRRFRRVAGIAAAAATLLVACLLTWLLRGRQPEQVHVPPAPSGSAGKVPTVTCVPAVKPSSYLFVNVAAPPAIDAPHCRMLRRSEEKMDSSFILIVVAEGS